MIASFLLAKRARVRKRIRSRVRPMTNRIRNIDNETSQSMIIGAADKTSCVPLARVNGVRNHTSYFAAILLAHKLPTINREMCRNPYR